MRPPRLGPARLAVRIYLVSVAAVLAMLMALLVVLRLAWDPRRDPFMRSSSSSAKALARRWPSAAALGAELERMRRETGQMGAAFRWDGTLVAAAGPPPPPLSPDELRALQEGGFMPRRCGGWGPLPGAGPGEERGPGPQGAREPGTGRAPDAGRGPAAARELPAPGPMGGPGPPDDPGPEGDARQCGDAFVLGPGTPPAGYALIRFGHLPLPPFREILPIGLVLAGLGFAAVLLGRSIARPLQQLARAAQALGRGDLSARTGIKRSDELGEVARSFDEMAERVVILLRSQTELIANVAHELRTPLARIRVALDLAVDGGAEAARTSLEEISEDLGDLERLVEDVLASSRMDLSANTARGGGAPPIHRTRVDLTGVLRGAVERLSHRYPSRSARLDLQGPLPLVDGDAVLLRRALDNLLDNARKYSPPESAILLRAAAREGKLVIEVIDQGEGIAPEDLARLFTPFFRADPSRARRTGGVGLGLTLSRRIVEAHEGTLVAESVAGAGTTMTITLPAVAGPQHIGTGE